MASETLIFFLDQPLKQWLTWIIRGEDKIQTFQYLENEKSFLGPKVSNRAAKKHKNLRIDL